MERMEGRIEMGGTGRSPVETLVERLATVGPRGESVAEVAHDARNMVTALGLYCDLLEEPGVLAVPFRHYGNELRMVAAASRRLVEKLASLDRERAAGPGWKRGVRPGVSANAVLQDSSPVTADSQTAKAAADRLAEGILPDDRRPQTSSHWDLMPSTPIENMAAELLANHNLLAALAGPTIALTVDVERGARPVRLTGEDLTRVLVNLVKNAAEAMPAGGRIQIGLSELCAEGGATEALMLTMEDNGPGIPEEALEAVFTSGFTTRSKGTEGRGSWPVIHRGLGLTITRSIVEAAGGRVLASRSALGGARFVLELPVR